MKTLKEFVSEARALSDDEDAGSGNIVMQMRKVVSLRGNYDVKFDDGSKAKVSPATAQAFLHRFNTTKRPAEKQTLQQMASKNKEGLETAAKGGAAPKKPDALALKTYK